MAPTGQTRKLSPLRATIARRMHESMQATAQISYHAELDARALVAARQAWRAVHPKISYEDLVIWELARLLPQHPSFNGTFVNGELTLSAAVHIGVAVPVPDGLMVPTIFDVQGKSLHEIAETRADLIARVRTGALGMREMSGGTITISNMGLSRTRFFTPILNSPQIAILGLGQIADRPWVVEGVVKAVPVMGLSLTADHRLVDGQPSGAMLTALCEALERVGGPTNYA